MNDYGEYMNGGFMFAHRRDSKHLNEINRNFDLNRKSFNLKTDELVRPLVLRAARCDVIRIDFYNDIPDREASMHLASDGYTADR